MLPKRTPTVCAIGHSAMPLFRLGHALRGPLVGEKRTFLRLASMSAFDPKRTSASSVFAIQRGSAVTAETR